VIKITEQIESYIKQLEELTKNVSFFYKLEVKVSISDLTAFQKVVNKLIHTAYIKGRVMQ